MSRDSQFEEFSQAAEAGNPVAQFNMGLWYLRQPGARPFPPPAREWFGKAAEQGFAPAQTMIGRMHLGFPGGGRDAAAARLSFALAAEQGFAEAQYQLAELCVATGDDVRHYSEARNWLEKASAADHALAMCQLAYLLDEGIGGATDPGRAIALYQRSAELGMPRAWNQLGHCFEIGHGLAQDPELAAAAYRRAAERQYPGAARAATRLEASMQDSGKRRSAAAADTDLTGAPTGRSFVPRPECVPTVLSGSPRIALLKGLFSQTECQHLIAAAKPHLEPSRIVSDAGDNVLDHNRSSWEMRFYPEAKDMLIWIYERRLARLSETRAEQGEALLILRYEQAQEYRTHVDFFDPELPGQKAHIEASGQRILTMLTYLSEVEEGGGTEFPALGITVEPEAGATLAFFNVTPDGQVDRRTLHAGLPVTSGTKWLATRWIRDRDWVDPRS